jgi:hypothetical protein
VTGQVYVAIFEYGTEEEVFRGYMQKAEADALFHSGSSSRGTTESLTVTSTCDLSGGSSKQ